MITELGECALTLTGRLKMCGVIRSRFDAHLKDLDDTVLLFHQFGLMLRMPSVGIRDQEETRQKHTVRENHGISLFFILGKKHVHINEVLPCSVYLTGLGYFCLVVLCWFFLF